MMDMSNKVDSRRRSSREEKSARTTRDERKKFLQPNNSGDLNFVNTLPSRHFTSSPEAIMHSSQRFTEENSGRRAPSSRASSSSSPAPLNDNFTNNGSGNSQHHRRSSDAFPDSPHNSHNNGTGDSSSSGAIPLTKNVGVSVNFGKINVKSNSLATAGAQHVTPNGHQHQQQQHTPETASIMAISTVNNASSNNNNGSNSAAINLGHGHIGTIAGPPSVSISSGLGQVGVGPSSASNSVHHISSLSPSPAANAPTTCANKGVPSSHNQQQQQQHLSIQSPTNNHPRMSPNSPNPPIVDLDIPESLQAGGPQPATEAGKNGNSSSSSSSSTSSSSRNGGNGNNKNNSGGIQTGPNSPAASSTASSSSCSGGSKGETQPNVRKTNLNGSTGKDGSSKSTNRIVSQNVNGTLVETGVPSNECELQLFRVLQRANLLSYFDNFIELGGDDVQQLCDAPEVEFLEIMALIGMASKPLHVRRLQKALQEWMTQPNLFQAPVLPPGYTGISSTSNSSLQALPQFDAAAVSQIPVSHLPYHAMAGPTAGLPVFYPGITAASLLPVITDTKGSSSSPSEVPNHSAGISYTPTTSIDNTNSSGNPYAAIALQQANTMNPQVAQVFSSLSPNSTKSSQQRHSSSRHSGSNGHHIMRSSTGNYGKDGNPGRIADSPVSMSDIKFPIDQLIPSHFLETRIRTNSELSSPASSIAGSPHPEGRNSVSPVPCALQEHEIQKLADAAIHLIRSLPPSVAEPKFSSKRKTSADYELILRLSDADPRKIMDEVRRVAAVYGRADAKRKTVKPLSMHELSINEAAAQLCKHVPALLTKREELLSLSRQVLRESGLPYAAVSSTFSIPIFTNGFINTANTSISINNNDINTKSKYDEKHRNHKKRESSASSADKLNGNIFNGFHGKRLRLDDSSGIEIQEYHHSSTFQDSPSPPSSNNGMQITELRCLPPRRSPSDEILPSPLELVTVTSSDLRKNGNSSGLGKPSSSVSSIDSNSPPIRRPYSVESDDLSNNSNNFHSLHGMRVGHQELINVPSSVKVASIPVSGGSISILNHNVNNHFSHHFHPQYTGNTHSRMKFTPIKSEPTTN